MIGNPPTLVPCAPGCPFVRPSNPVLFAAAAAAAGAPGKAGALRPAPPAPISPQAVAAEVEPPLSSWLWANFVTTVLQQFAVSVFGIRVVLDFPGQLAKAVDPCSKPLRVAARKEDGGDADGVVSGELFVSCVEVFAKPLEHERAGIKFVVRVEQVRECFSFCFSAGIILASSLVGWFTRCHPVVIDFPLRLGPELRLHRRQRYLRCNA